MVIFSWVAPIMDHFDTILDALKRFMTAWGTHRTSVSFPFSPPCIFIFTETSILNFVFWPFPTVTLISHFRHMSCISCCMLCVMTHCCIQTIIRYLLPCRLLGKIHKCGSHKEVFNVVVFPFPFILPTINSPVSSFSKIVVLSVEEGISVMAVVSVVVYSISVSQTIWPSLDIFVTLVTFALE